MIGFECNSNNEVRKVINKLAFVNNVADNDLYLYEKLTMKIINEATKVGYPVIVIKNLESIEYAFGNDVKDDVDVIPYKEFWALNLFKRVPSRHIELLLDYMKHIANNVSVKTIKLVLEEYQAEIEAKEETENERYSVMVGKCFLMISETDDDTFYVKILGYDSFSKRIEIEYIYISDTSINYEREVLWNISQLNFFSLKEITEEKYESIIKQYTNIVHSISNIE